MRPSARLGLVTGCAALAAAALACRPTTPTVQQGSDVGEKRDDGAKQSAPGPADANATGIDAAREAAIAAANEGSTLELESTLVTGTLPNAKGAFGHGVLALLGARVGVARSVVERSAAVGVVFADASGSVRRSTVRHNAIGIHAQQGSTIVESEAVPEAITGGEVVVTTDSRFTDNASKVGSGVVPLPNVVPPL